MTAFFTHCWQRLRLKLAAALACALLAAALPLQASAQETAAEGVQLRLERSADGVLLFANVKVDLPAVVEDALLKGVPLFFVAQAELTRKRWYWSDKTVASAQRHMRLAYQPLTRRWRLNVASGAITSNSLGLALNLSFESLAEAMAAMQRLSGWKIAEAGAIDPETQHRLEFRFSLDLTQLPRPFQIGALGHSDWNISVSATQQLGPEGAK